MPIPMSLTVTAGPCAGQSRIVMPGETLTVGRAPEAAWCLAGDTFLSAIHFQIEYSGDEWQVADSGSRNGTLLDSVAVTRAVAPHGSTIQAGSSTFLAELGEKRGDTPQQRFVAYLRGHKRMVYAILDSAKSPTVAHFLRRVPGRNRSLLDGPSAPQFVAVAPYLVGLDSRAVELDVLVHEAWQQNWALWMFSGARMTQLRSHLRKFLLVRDDTGKELYFRFYDPRVLRAFLPEATAAQRTEFFGPIKMIFAETEGSLAITRFTLERGQLQQSDAPYLERQ